MPDESVPKKPSIAVDHGDAISAPPPKPITASPVAIPGLSGNHRPQKQHVAANIAIRGPLRSTQVPNTAAESPRTTMPTMNAAH